jgi:hypothetical protein
MLPLVRKGVGDLRLRLTRELRADRAFAPSSALLLAKVSGTGTTDAIE